MTASIQTESKPFSIIVVGGAGAMGRHVVRALARLGSARRITVADLDSARAGRLADEIGPVAHALQLDATDPAAMRQAFSGHDAVLNTMGPFARFGTPILRAALESGCDYLDIDDDWQSTLEAFDFDAQARSLGRRVVIGMGASPGTTNLCARIAAERLDTVHELHTGWSMAAAIVEPEPAFAAGTAAAKHWLLQCTGKIRAWSEGCASDIDPLARVDFNFPGLGAVHAYTMGHPEPITLPRAFAGLQRALNLQCGPDELFDQLRTVVVQVESGAMSVDEAANLLDSRTEMPTPADTPTLPPLFALARGSRGGRKLAVAAYPRVELPGAMGGNTGIPLAIGLELIRRGVMSDVGVHAPETAFNPRDYFDLYRHFVTGATTAIEDILVIDETED
ncbi:MAG: saccharopine dehydrogenase NADP-binding domain-containing protein [Comamonadaceae bacterium]|mgnify:CR=1 FL=1|nr:saccharopine dehydrogenase NADP-binding domain-containing protein [Comamonadaceae bacterium]